MSPSTYPNFARLVKSYDRLSIKQTNTVQARKTWASYLIFLCTVLDTMTSSTNFFRFVALHLGHKIAFLLL